MRFRTLALALALSCGITGLAEAKKKPAVHRVTKVKRNKAAARVKRRKVKSRKAVAKAAKRRAKHS
jgi:hypothetical protein